MKNYIFQNASVSSQAVVVKHGVSGFAYIIDQWSSKRISLHCNPDLLEQQHAIIISRVRERCLVILLRNAVVRILLQNNRGKVT